jgi:hypothetical protein
VCPRRASELISPRRKCALPWFQSETALCTKKTNLMEPAAVAACARLAEGVALRELPVQCGVLLGHAAAGVAASARLRAPSASRATRAGSSRSRASAPASAAGSSGGTNSAHPCHSSRKVPMSLSTSAQPCSAASSGASPNGS